MQADLSEANLRGADLSRTFLTAATMPNGQRYEAWLRDEERHGEDGENAALRNGPQNELRGNPISRSSHSGHSRKFVKKGVINTAFGGYAVPSSGVWCT
jgi:hypothetical protein